MKQNQSVEGWKVGSLFAIFWATADLIAGRWLILRERLQRLPLDRQPQQEQKATPEKRQQLVQSTSFVREHVTGSKPSD